MSNETKLGISRREFFTKTAQLGAGVAAYLTFGADEAEAAPVRVKRSPDISRRAIKTVSAGQSKNGIVVAVYGDEQEFHDGMIKGAEDAVDAGYKVVGVIIGDRNYASEAEIYLGGRPWVTITGNNAETQTRAKNGVEIAYANHQEAILSSLDNDDTQPS